MRDIYQEVTDKLLAQLAAGTLPWVRPWNTGNAGAPSLPYSMISQKAYSGVNIPILWGAGYASQGWMTYKQAQSLGAQVRAGEKGTTGVYMDKFIPKAEKGNDDAKARYFLKAFTLFNAEQIDGLPVVAAPVAQSMPERHAEADRVIAATGATFHIGGDKAYYVPSADFIATPPPAAYDLPLAWYRTAFHELGHWTGHKARLDRDLANRFGSHAYAAEELVAEMSSAFSCARLGLEPGIRHADYLASWIAAMKENNRIIFSAASAASKATDYVFADRETAKAAA